MRKIVLTAALIGFLAAVLLAAITLYREHHGMSVPFMPVGLLLCLWPAAIMLLDADENLRGFVWFLTSAIANGLIYGAVALCVGSVARIFLQDRRDRRSEAGAAYPGGAGGHEMK